MLNRRSFLQTTLGAAPAILSAQSRRPNVLMISVDDWNDWVGVLGGHPKVQTPHLDRLAARGMLFADAHCAAPICNPSRAALMTGRRPTTSGVYGNSQPWRLAMPDVATLPQYFRTQIAYSHESIWVQPAFLSRRMNLASLIRIPPTALPGVIEL